MTPNKDIVHDQFLVKALMFEELGGDEMIQRMKNHDRTPNTTQMLHYEEIESEWIPTTIPGSVGANRESH